MRQMINWSRVIIGGLIAALIAFLTDGFLHERLLSGDWRAVLVMFLPKHTNINQSVVF
jgi:hypothetical protein